MTRKMMIKENTRCFLFGKKLTFIIFVVFNFLQWNGASGSIWPICNQSGITVIRLQLPFDETNRFLDAPKDSLLAMLASVNDRILEPVYRLEMEFLDTGGNFTRDVELSGQLAFNDDLLFFLFPTSIFAVQAFLGNLEFLASQESDPEEADAIRFGYPVIAPLDPSPGIRQPFRRNVINHLAGYVDEIETMVDFASQRLNFSRIGLFDTGFIPLQDILSKALQRKNRRLIGYRFNPTGVVTTEELEYFESLNLDTLIVGAAGVGVVPFFLESVDNGGYLNGTDIFLPTLSGTASEVQQSGNQLFSRTGLRQRIFGTAFISSWSPDDVIQEPFDPNQLMSLNQRYNLDLQIYDPSFFDKYPGFIPLPPQVFTPAVLIHVAQILSTIQCEDLTRESFLQKFYTLSSVRVATDVVYGPYNDICVGPQDPECCNEGVKQLTIGILNVFANSWDTTFVKQWDGCRSIVEDPAQLPISVLIATAGEPEEFVRFVQFGAKDSLENTRISPFTLNYRVKDNVNGGNFSGAMSLSEELERRAYYREMKDQDDAFVIVANSFYLVEDPTFNKSIVAIETDSILSLTMMSPFAPNSTGGTNITTNPEDPEAQRRDGNITLINIFPDLSDRLYSVFTNERNTRGGIILIGNVQGRQIPFDGVTPIVDLWSQEFSTNEVTISEFTPESLSLISPFETPFVIVIDDLVAENSLLLSETLSNQLNDDDGASSNPMEGSGSGGGGGNNNFRLYFTETFSFQVDLETLETSIPNGIFVWLEPLQFGNESTLILDFLAAKETFIFERDQLITEPVGDSNTTNSTKKRNNGSNAMPHNNNNNNNNNKDENRRQQQQQQQQQQRQQEDQLFSNSIVPSELTHYITGRFISSVVLGINGAITADSFLNSLYSTGTFSIEQGLTAGPFERYSEEEIAQFAASASPFREERANCNKGLRSLILMDISSMSLSQDVPFPSVSWETCGAQPQPREELSGGSEDDNDIGLIVGTITGAITFVSLLIVCCLVIVILVAFIIIMILLVMLSSSMYFIATRKAHYAEVEVLELPKEPNYYDLLFPYEIEEHEQVDANMYRVMPMMRDKIIKKRTELFKEFMLDKTYSLVVTKAITSLSETAGYYGLADSVMNIFYDSDMAIFILDQLVKEEIEMYQMDDKMVIMREDSTFSSMYKRYAFMVGLPYLWKALSGPFYDLYHSIMAEKKRVQALVQNGSCDAGSGGFGSADYNSANETGSSSGGEGRGTIISMDWRTNSAISEDEQYKRNTVKNLIVYKMKMFTQNVFASLSNTPFPRQLSALISQITQQISKIEGTEEQDVRNWLGSCIFFKFIIPVMKNPYEFSLCPQKPEGDFLRAVNLSCKLIKAMAINSKFGEKTPYAKYNELIDSNEKEMSEWLYKFFYNENDDTEDEAKSDVFKSSSSSLVSEEMEMTKMKTKMIKAKKPLSNEMELFVFEVPEEIQNIDVKKVYTTALMNADDFIINLKKGLGKRSFLACERLYLRELGFYEDDLGDIAVLKKNKSRKNKKSNAESGDITDRSRSSTKKRIPPKKRKDKSDEDSNEDGDDSEQDFEDLPSVQIVSDDYSSEENFGKSNANGDKISHDNIDDVEFEGKSNEDHSFPMRVDKNSIHGDVSHIKAFINASNDHKYSSEITDPINDNNSSDALNVSGENDDLQHITTTTTTTITPHENKTSSTEDIIMDVGHHGDCGDHDIKEKEKSETSRSNIPKRRRKKRKDKTQRKTKKENEGPL